MQRKTVVNRTVAIISGIALVMLIVLVIGILANVEVLAGGRPTAIEVVWRSASRSAMENQNRTGVQTSITMDGDYMVVSANQDQTTVFGADDDNDGDGLPDQWEEAHQLNPRDATGDQGAAGDPDRDELSNIDEYYNGSHPQNADTDGDGMPDLWEVENNLNPADATGDNGSGGDLDGDGVRNGDEYDENTDPSSSDSNRDGQSDGEAHYARLARRANGQMYAEAPDGEPYRARRPY